VPEMVTVYPPSLWIMGGACAAVCVIGLAAARARIRAVEVVRG
jgi:hypothetical protein